MPRRMVSLVLFWLIACGLSLDPDTWLRDISRLGKRTKPKVENVTFWDFEQGQFRGVRAFLYTLPKERENRALDYRLHQKMVQFLSAMCQEVITLESIEDPARRRMVETALVPLVEQWKLNGKIDPAAFFSAVPFLDGDVLMFMERVQYDQVFDQERKRLAIGLDAAVFEMDFGEALYLDRMTAEVPWQGEDTSYAKAEHAALLKLADAVGESLQQAAELINKAHEQDVKQTQAAQRQQEREQKAQVQEENQRLSALIKQAEAVVKANREPKPLLNTLARDAAALKPLIKRSPPDLTPEIANQRQELANAIQTRLQEFETWKTGRIEDPAASLASPRPLIETPPAALRLGDSDPIPAGPAANPIPRAGQASVDPRDRNWLLPDAKTQAETGPIQSAASVPAKATVTSGTAVPRLPASFLKLRPVRNAAMP